MAGTPMMARTEESSDSKKRPLTDSETDNGELPPRKIMTVESNVENSDTGLTPSVSSVPSAAGTNLQPPVNKTVQVVLNQDQLDKWFKAMEGSMREEVRSSVLPEIKLLTNEFNLQRKEIEDLKKATRWTPFVSDNNNADLDEILETWRGNTSAEGGSVSNESTRTGPRGGAHTFRGRPESTSSRGRGSSYDRSGSYDNGRGGFGFSRPGSNRGQEYRGASHRGFNNRGRGGFYGGNHGEDGGENSQNYTPRSKEEPIGDMSYRNLESMMRRVNRESQEKSRKAYDFASKEIILIGFPEATDDVKLAMKQLKIVDPNIIEWEIAKVQRFRQADKTGFVPLKVIFKRISVAERLSETIELAGDGIPWARRGQTFQQRRDNGRELKNIDWLNSQFPEGHPTRWEYYYQRGNIIKYEAPNPAASRGGASGSGEPQRDVPDNQSARENNNSGARLKDSNPINPINRFGVPNGHLTTGQTITQEEADKAMSGVDKATAMTSAKNSSNGRGGQKKTGRGGSRGGIQQPQITFRKQDEVRVSDLSKEQRDRLFREIQEQKAKEDEAMDQQESSGGDSQLPPTPPIPPQPPIAGIATRSQSRV